MSHIAVRILADRLGDLGEGINALIAGDLPIDDGDREPGGVRVYNELDHNWVARRKIPQPSADVIGDVKYPCVVVFLYSLDDPAGIAAEQDTGARTTTVTVTLCAHLLMQDADTNSTDGMYLLRALRGVIHRLNRPSDDAARERIGSRLWPATAMRQAQLTAFSEDTVYSPGSVLVTYPCLETVPLT